MDVSREIILSDEWWARCVEWATLVVAVFAEGGSPLSQAFSMNGQEFSVYNWTKAQAGEVAFAIWCGLDPATAVSWETRPDKGKDVTAFGMRWDVKTIEDYKRLLCWCVTKNDLYLDKDFHALVLMKATTHNGELTHGFRVSGFTTKLGFYCMHAVADGVKPKGIYRNTWYMDEAALWKMRDLLAARGAA